MQEKRREVNFVRLYITLLEYKSIVQQKWIQVISVALISGILGVIYAWSVPKTYIAKLTFAIEDKSSSGIYSSLASQFGVDLSKGDGGAFKGDNIVELFRSHSMIEKTLLTKNSFDGKEQLLIEKYLDIAKVNREKVSFDFNRPRDLYTRVEDSLLQAASDDIINHKLQSDKPDKKLSFIEYKFKSVNETFAKVFLEHLVLVIKKAYVSQKTKKAKANIATLEMRIDSVKNELNQEMNGSANAQDQNQNAAVARVKIPILKRQMNIQLLTTLFGELTKNLELSKMSLANEEPLIEMVDTPMYPLNYEKKSRLVTGGLFFMLGAFLTSLYFILKELFKEFNKFVEVEKSKK
ncbi:MAG TPA: hypothetical protein DIU05_12340 [Bacteroidetes bacterium]|jgi:hypothetical protein|nr:hypothetical protein [Bacteroidota bacterium]